MYQININDKDKYSIEKIRKVVNPSTHLPIQTTGLILLHLFRFGNVCDKVSLPYNI